MHAIIFERRRGSGIFFEEMQNGAIWGHFKVSYNRIKHYFNDFDRQEFPKIVQNLPFVS
jgi:hypothetical protein